MEMKVKNFKITGFYPRQKRRFYFTKYVRALNEDTALEKALSSLNIGKSRKEIHVTKIEEIPSSQIGNDQLRKIAGMEKPSILGRE